MLNRMKTIITINGVPSTRDLNTSFHTRMRHLNVRPSQINRTASSIVLILEELIPTGRLQNMIAQDQVTQAAKISEDLDVKVTVSQNFGNNTTNKYHFSNGCLLDVS